MKLNEECRDEIDDAISYNYNGLCLDDGAVQQVLAGYGAERTRYIVAAAIQVRDGDARISPQNRRWADSVRKIKDINADGYDKAAYYANLQSHAGLIDIFTSRLRQLEREKQPPKDKRGVTHESKNKMEPPPSGAGFGSRDVLHLLTCRCVCRNATAAGKHGRC